MKLVEPTGPDRKSGYGATHLCCSIPTKEFLLAFIL